MNNTEKIKIFDNLAKKRGYWREKNSYYYKDLENFLKFAIPEKSRVLEMGCGTGDTLYLLKPKTGVGIDFSNEMIKTSIKKYGQRKNLSFKVMDAENVKLNKKFDYVVMSNLIGDLTDVWACFRQLKKVTDENSRVVITHYNYLWEPVLKILEKLNLKMSHGLQNWMSIGDVENLLYLNGFEVIKWGKRFLFPIYIPVLSGFLNRYVSKLPAIRNLCLTEYVIARKTYNSENKRDYSCSVIVPTRNEAGNVEDVVKSVPDFGKHIEIIFVDGNSTDGTVEKIRNVMKKYKDKDIKLIRQGSGAGKGDAVRKGFDAARGRILMILDADLTTPAEDLPKFYLAVKENRGELVMGSRLVYQMENQAMRALHIFGNNFFSSMFSWILGQRIRDTLCGTKVLTMENYRKIKNNRKFFGDFDPFGDFDLIFGAAKQNMKIVEIPVRYRQRTYGVSNVSSFRHGWLLLRMLTLGLKKLKFN